MDLPMCNKTIVDFINELPEYSYFNVKLTLREASFSYKYMNELSIKKLLRLRICGKRTLKSMIEIYPNIKDEDGLIKDIFKDKMSLIGGTQSKTTIKVS